MRIYVLAVGTRMPGWVADGYASYARRLPKGWLRLSEIPLGNRSAGAHIDKARHIEGERLLAAVPSGARIIALQAARESWSTEQLTKNLQRWMHDGRDAALLIGGPDGLSEACLHSADDSWSLSALTFPHALVRVIVVEQIYRAWSSLNGHPYHRS